MRTFSAAGLPVSKRAYVVAAFSACVFSGTGAWVLAASLGLGYAGWAGVSAAGACAIACAWLPSVLARRQQQRLESHVGSLLRLLSVRLSFEPFEAALGGSVRRLPRAHPGLLRLARDLDRGVPPLSALSRLSSSTHSVLVRKAMMQLAFCYRQGDSSALFALAGEFSQAHASDLQRFASRTSFASVWFEAVAALLPLLLSAYVLVGASFLQFTFAPAWAFWVLALALPLCNAALVAHIWLAAPEDGA